MKNIIKTLIVMLSSVSLFGLANAGELSVSGTAKASYNVHGGDSTNQGKGLGITNELNFTASGELDNGYTWSYSMELDPGAVNAAGVTDNAEIQDAHNDDTKLTMTTPYGTVGMFISEGGLDVEDAASQSVYARPTDMGDPSATSDNFTIDSYNNVQYHTPADLLPFGTSFKIAYATNTADISAGSSGDNAGGVTTGAVDQAGATATEMQVKATPIDGLTVGTSYFQFGGDQGMAKNDQEAESGAYYATFATGPVSVGFSQAYRAELLEDASIIASDKTTNIASIDIFISFLIFLEEDTSSRIFVFLSDEYSSLNSSSSSLIILFSLDLDFNIELISLFLSFSFSNSSLIFCSSSLAMFLSLIFTIDSYCISVNLPIFIIFCFPAPWAYYNNVFLL